MMVICESWLQLARNAMNTWQLTFLVPNGLLPFYSLEIVTHSASYLLGIVVLLFNVTQTEDQPVIPLGFARITVN